MKIRRAFKSQQLEHLVGFLCFAFMFLLCELTSLFVHRVLLFSISADKKEKQNMFDVRVLVHEVTD